MTKNVNSKSWTFTGSPRAIYNSANLDGGGAAPTGGLMLGDFETDIYVINPAAGNDHTKYLWNQYPNGDTSDPSHEDNGTISYNTSDVVTNSRSLQIDMLQSPNGDNGAPYLQYYTHNGADRWHYIREIVENFLSEGPWELNKYNRLEFYIKAPSSLTLEGAGRHNMSVGTYTSEVAAGGPTASDAEAGTGWHYYHRYDLAPGVWNKCIMDFHPTHSRDADGGTDQGNLPNPTGDVGYNYFDTLTRLYWDVEEGNTTAPSSTWLFDSFRFYEETNTEEEDKVYSVCGSYNSGTNQITLGWNRNKADNSLNHEVRYAFSDIHALGFDNATAAPSGTVSPDGFGGYNQILYQTTLIDVSGQSSIFLAIRPVGGSNFKQIELRLDL